MNINNIKEQLKDFKEIKIDIALKHLEELSNQKNKEGKFVNTWAKNLSENIFIELFKKAEEIGLSIDGKHVVISNNFGNIVLGFDYIALKNLMYLKYPESIIDLQLVYKGDEISFGKESGKIAYKHIIANPFETNDNEIVGGYCIIKNKRGEFLTTLSSGEIEKHRKKAKGDFIWKDWFKDMALKTIIKKAVKIHFEDVFSEVIEIDNENNDLDNPIDIELSWKQEIDKINDLEILKEYWLKNQGKGKDFAKYVTKRKSEIEKETLKSNNEQNENT